jgi:DNA invertase Pin-like site-specific DNA recombinase
MSQAAIYLRVSSERQGRDNKVSLPEQERACRELAARLGLEVVAVYCDKERYRPAGSSRLAQPSGERIDRPAFGLLLAEAGRLWTVLIAWAQDRLARGNMATAVFQETVDRTGIQVQLATETWDADLAGIRGAIGGYELRKIKERTRMGREGRLRRGLHTGPAPFGYAVRRDELGRNVGYTFERRCRRTFDRLAELFLAHKSYVEIQQRVLNPDTGQPFKYPALRYLFRSPFYRGELDYSRRLGWKGKKKPPRAKGQHEPAWDAATCAAIENELARRAAAGRSAPRRRRHDYLFAGLLRCGHCGRLMAATPSGRRGDGEPFKAYRCNTPLEHRHGGSRYPNHEPNYINEIKLLKLLESLIESLTPAEVDRFLDSTVLPVRRESDLAPAEIAALEERAEELRVGYLAIASSGAASELLLAELERVEKSVARLKAETGDEPAEPRADRKQVRAAMLALIEHPARIRQGRPARVRAWLAEAFPALYVAGGKIAGPPDG